MHLSQVLIIQLICLILVCPKVSVKFVSVCLYQITLKDPPLLAGRSPLETRIQFSLHLLLLLTSYGKTKYETPTAMVPNHAMCSREFHHGILLESSFESLQ